MAAATVAAHLLYAVSAGPAPAMQILDAADHAELAAEISAAGVNRIALSHDRVRRVIRSPGGFEIEHDPETGDLWLRALAPRHAAVVGPAAGPGIAAPARATLFIGTEKGFTYRLTLTPADRESAQILIRNGAALAGARAEAPPAGTDVRVVALVGLVRAVARRELPAGYVIETAAGRAVGGLPVIETWRGPRFAAHVVETDGPGDAAALAGTLVDRAAAVWLAQPGTGPSGGRLAVIVAEPGAGTRPGSGVGPGDGPGDPR